MAERRMFAKTIIDSDAFLDMPQSTQLLYFHLAMRADDDGFVNKPKSIMRDSRSNDDDIKLLMAKKFIIPFESGVIVIKHWRIHNLIRLDRYNETKYTEEKSTLYLDDLGAYTQSKHKAVALPPTKDSGGKPIELDVGLPSVNQRLPQDRLGKDSIVQDNYIESGKSTRFTPPTLQEMTDYCNERCNNVDPSRFIDFYESKGWMVGKNKMKDWKAAVRNWEKREPKKTESSFDVEDFFSTAINKTYGG